MPGKQLYLLTSTTITTHQKKKKKSRVNTAKVCIVVLEKISHLQVKIAAIVT